MFIEPKVKYVKLSKLIDADCVELHTGNFCNLFNKKKNTKKVLTQIKMASEYAHKMGMEVHAGHGLTYSSVKLISKIRYISEFNIGHFIVSESILVD